MLSPSSSQAPRVLLLALGGTTSDGPPGERDGWRPAFARYLYPRYTGLRRELDTYLVYYKFDRVHTERLTRGQIPGDIVYGARKMEVR
jgi:hypothetical protein